MFIRFFHPPLFFFSFPFLIYFLLLMLLLCVGEERKKKKDGESDSSTSRPIPHSSRNKKNIYTRKRERGREIIWENPFKYCTVYGKFRLDGTTPRLDDEGLCDRDTHSLPINGASRERERKNLIKTEGKFKDNNTQHPSHLFSQRL